MPLNLSIDMQSPLLNSSQGHPQNYVHWFRNSAPYINAHRNKTFVIMFDGEAVQHDNFQHIIHDIALLHSLGIRLILVHGARPQINENLKNLQDLLILSLEKDNIEKAIILYNKFITKK